MKYTVGLEELAKIFPSWQRQSICHFLKYYSAFSFCAPKKLEERKHTETLQQVVQELEMRVALLLDRPVTTAAERSTRLGRSSGRRVLEGNATTAAERPAVRIPRSSSKHALEGY